MEKRYCDPSYRVVGNIVDAEDVAQDVLLEAFQKYQSTGQLPEIALLSRMATLRAIDHLRKKRPTISFLESDLTSDSRVVKEIVHAEMVVQLQSAIASLPKREGECFWLRYGEELSNEEISALLKISTTAVSTAIHKARKTLQTIFGHTEFREPIR